MGDLIINVKTSSQIDLAKKSTSHAYLFAGKDGLGKTTVARHFAESILGEEVNTGDKERWILFVEPKDSKKLSIDQMKSVREFCNRSVAGNLKNKVVIIDKAERMSMEAYNSLLTILEEPPQKTVIVLVTSSKLSIPKTILSRLAQINFYPPNNNQLVELIDKNNIPNELGSYVSTMPAKIESFSSKKDEMLSTFNQAKTFIEGGLKDRLMIISTLKDKNDTNDLLLMISHIVQLNHTLDRWLQRSESLILAQSHLYNNGNYKLVMENMALEF